MIWLSLLLAAVAMVFVVAVRRPLGGSYADITKAVEEDVARRSPQDAYDELMQWTTSVDASVTPKLAACLSEGNAEGARQLVDSIAPMARPETLDEVARLYALLNRARLVDRTP